MSENFEPESHLSEEEVKEIFESKFSITNAFTSKDLVLAEIDSFIEGYKDVEDIHDIYDETFINYGKLECLFLLNLIGETYFRDKSSQLSDLLKERKSNKDVI